MRQVLRNAKYMTGILAFAGMVFMAVPAKAQSPHYISSPTPSCSGTSLEVNFKAAGLGNVHSVSYSLTCDSINVTGQCYTKSGNPVNGTTKSGTASGYSSGSLPVHNGSTSGPIDLSPANLTFSSNFNPGCTGSQKFVITSAAYSSCNFTLGPLGTSGLNDTTCTQ